MSRAKRPRTRARSSFVRQSLFITSAARKTAEHVEG